MDAPQAQVAEPATAPVSAGSLVPALAAPPPVGPVSASAVWPASEHEAKLCEEAGAFDWPYLGALVLADAGAIVLDSQGFQSSGQPGVRLLGPGVVGLAWGWTVGGTYLTLPQCSKDFARTRPLEGDSRSVWPLTLSFTLLAAATAPAIVGVETGEGNATLAWSPAERAMRLVIASATGALGSVMPYVLPPSTWRALRKLDRLRAGATAHGAMLTYAVRF